ncbi:MAG: YeiH family protein [Pseudorhodoplanes sp.]|uniref:YeiH family protein n=1 Tax=Pseudorhodoplanes sp. TaxID=1934341 RepID=UPI003D103F56
MAAAQGLAIRDGLRQLWPGVSLAVVIAIAAFSVRQLPSLSVLTPLSVAVLIGMAIGNGLVLPARMNPGVGFAARHVLRFAIVLLGFQLSATQIAAFGMDGAIIVIAVVAIVFIATGWLGSLLGVDAKLSQLIAAGTSVCGASAVVAMNSVTESTEEDVIYAVGSVTLFGTLLMFLLPVLAYGLGLGALDFGVWAGASIHEIAQVTGAAFQFSPEAGESAVVVKLTRVLMLAPLIAICGLWLRRRRAAADGTTPPAFPIFVLGFVGAVVLNSLMPLPADMRANLMVVTSFLMSVALAALGLQTSFRKLTAKGLRPLALGAVSTILIVGLSLGLIRLAHWLA